jgi:hypothetical protein
MSQIVMQAPAANQTFVLSDGTFVSDQNGLIVLSNANQVTDQLSLIQAGCVTLSPAAGGLNAIQNGTSYTVQMADYGQEIICTNGSAFTFTLPKTMPVGFYCYGTQGGAGTVTGTAGSGASVVGSHADTSGQYFQIKCVVIANSTGIAAVWAVMRVGA